MHAFKSANLIGLILLGICVTARAAEPEIEILRSRTYVTRDSGPLDADVYMPPGTGPFPGMLVVHGGAWRVGSRAQLASVAARFAEHGYTAVAISYRLAPQSKFPAQIYDCQAAVRWMRTRASEFKIDPQRIGGFGYSAGGHLVAMLGTLDDSEFREAGVPGGAPSARLQCVLAGGAPCDFREMPADSSFLAYWLDGTRSEKPDNYRNASPATFITPDDPPMYFFSGVDDALVPIASPQKMVASLQKAGVTAEMHPIKNAGHLQAIFDQSAIDDGFAFADRFLKDAPPRTPEAQVRNATANSSADANTNSGAHDGQ
jgi:acetyl esterase/lipase